MKRRNLHRLTFGVVLIALAATSTWAASLERAAHLLSVSPILESLARSQVAHSEAKLRIADEARSRVPGRAAVPSSPTTIATLPAMVRFREVSGRGLMTRVWVNGAGSYTFAIDTGAGATLLSERVAREAGET